MTPKNSKQINIVQSGNLLHNRQQYINR